MAFKTIKNYNETKFAGTFRLTNDGDYADVVFLYRSQDDVMVADTHYLKSAEYNGYVHCNGRGCPACGKGIRIQTKLFVPMYNFTDNEIQFWDRTMTFEPQLMKDVFKNYPNPSEYVFRITRHGEPRDVNTRYAIEVIGMNKTHSFDKICAENHATFPEYFNTVCKEISNAEMSTMLTSAASGDSQSPADMPDYEVKPRVMASAPSFGASPSDKAMQEAIDYKPDPSVEPIDGDPEF